MSGADQDDKQLLDPEAGLGSEGDGNSAQVRNERRAVITARGHVFGNKILSRLKFLFI